MDLKEPALDALITVVIPTLPERWWMLKRAVNSVKEQVGLSTPARIVVECDQSNRGSAATRDAGLRKVRTKLVAFLDDDDELKPNHLSDLLDFMRLTDADFVFPWFTVVGGDDPFPHLFGKIWDPNNPTDTTITTLVRTELAMEVGFLSPDEREPELQKLNADDDRRFTWGCNKLGRIEHLPARTWYWYHHGKNTGGLPTR